MSTVDKRLLGAISNLMCLAAKPDLDEEGQRAMHAALDTLSERSGRTVAQALVEWQRAGCPRRDPRPARMAPLKGTEPLQTGRLGGAFNAS